MDQYAIDDHLTLFIVDPLSSKDLAVVIDFHRFTDCDLEAISDVNKRRDLNWNLSTVVHEKNVRLNTGNSSQNSVQCDISPTPPLTTL